MFEAKTRFSEIARWVMATGKSVRVTMRGKRGVRIVPDTPDEDQKARRLHALRAIREVREQILPASREEILKDLAEGRR